MKHIFKNEKKHGIQFEAQKKNSFFGKLLQKAGNVEVDRPRVVFSVLGFVFFLELCMTFYNSGTVSGVSAAADQYKQEAITDYNARTIAAGTIYDCNGTALVTTGANQWSQYIDPYAYTQILGYIKPISSGSGSYRLMSFLKDELYETSSAKSTQGSSFYLTLDNELQLQAYNLLVNTIGAGEIGSVVVMDAKTGAIRAFVSVPSFDANNLPESIQNVQNSNDSKINPGSIMSYPVAYKNRLVPGSIFKIVTSVALLENGLEDFTVLDNSFSVGDGKIVNHYSDTNMTIGYDTAVLKSSNVYFSSAALKMKEQGSAEALNDVAKRFMLGETLELDFGNVESNWDLDLKDDHGYAMTAFGQGKTLITTLNAAMIAQAIANDGQMMEPYMIQSKTDSDGRTVYEGKSSVLSEVTTEGICSRITEAMVPVGNSLGMSNVAAKTGTGQIGDANNMFNAWLMTFAPADDPQYVVVVNHCVTKQYGSSLAGVVSELYDILLKDGQ